MEDRIHSFLSYHQVLGDKRSTHNFTEFCRENDIEFGYLQRDNKNSELFEGVCGDLSFFGKRMPMIPDDFEALNDKNHVSVPSLLDPDAPYTVWREVFIHRLLNTLLLQNHTPHFPFFFGYHFSYDNDVYHDKQERPYLLLLQEKMDEDLKTWATREVRTEKQWFSCLIQIFFALGTLQQYAGVSHMDMHWGNVLVKKLPAATTWTYRLPNHQDYCLRDQEYLFFICDFGCAQFDVRDEMRDYRRLALNVFKWLQGVPGAGSPKQSPGPEMQRFLNQFHGLKNRKWKDVLEHVVAQHMGREATGHVYDMTLDRVEFFFPQKK